LTKLVAKKVVEQLKSISPGCLTKVEWFDASIGRSSSGGPIDIPVKSWGVFLGLFGERSKQIILAQNSFRYTDMVYDIDYTAIPIAWTLGVEVILKDHLGEEEVRTLLNSFINSFISGKSRSIHRKKIRQRRIINHERLD